MIKCKVIIGHCFYVFHMLCMIFQVEREMCSASAEFEDFVLQFMDRCVEFSFSDATFSNANDGDDITSFFNRSVVICNKGLVKNVFAKTFT